MARQIARADRGRILRIEYAARRRGHRERPQHALVVRHLGVNRADERVHREGIGIDERAVDRALDLHRGARIVHRDVAALDGQRRRDLQRLVVTVDFVFVIVAAVGYGLYLPAHGRFREVVDGRRQLVEALQPDFFHECVQPVGRDRARRHHRVNVAHDLVRHAHIAADDVEYVLIRLAALHQLADRELQAFLVDFAVLRGPAPAHVRWMRDHAAECNEFARAAENRRDHADVLQMATAYPWIVRDDDVARMPAFVAHGFHEMADGLGQRADERRRAGGRLRERVAVAVEQHHGVVLRLADNRRERGAHQRRRRLVDERDDAAPRDLHENRVVEFTHGHGLQNAISRLR